MPPISEEESQKLKNEILTSMTATLTSSSTLSYSSTSLSTSKSNLHPMLILFYAFPMGFIVLATAILLIILGTEIYIQCQFKRIAKKNEFEDQIMTSSRQTNEQEEEKL